MRFEMGINVAELDTSILTVGYGGMPDGSGAMSLDAAIMSGVDHAVGSVAALDGFRQPISIARAVMEKSRHSMLVGPGARDFAVKNGFVVEETLSDAAREKYSQWLKDENARPEFMHDTIGLLALDSHGNLAAGCSSSGMAFKTPGRVGDSPFDRQWALCR